MTTTEEHLQSPSKHMQARTHTSTASLARWASLRHSSSALHHRVKFVKSLLVVRKTQTDLHFNQKRKEKKACSAAKNRRLSLAVFLIYLDTGNTSSASSSSPAAAPLAPEDVGERSKSLSLLRRKDPSQLYRRFTLQVLKKQFSQN